MDIDCDGTQGGPADDGRCGKSTDTQSQTSFKDVIASYKKGVSDLDAKIHPYVVFGNTGTKSGYTNFDPEQYGIEPLSVMAVVCGEKLVYGIWGDENGDDGDHPMVGEASISLATACFGQGVNGNSGHDEDDVLYIAFPGSDAVPGADGADWGAKSQADFASSIQSLGDKLIKRIGSTGNSTGDSEPDPTTQVPTSTSSAASYSEPAQACAWSGHCAGKCFRRIELCLSHFTTDD
ncbi:uncharacterized protein JN550_000139 [Neoarthrinium moseri]|uniref:uncharacterized protein n=1 Tax=Neoarthrinium moseri TaxID=1658444 RepID=UPI001FDB9264|nr:uncharacterized protein JN550_000139 [Neoarthrinium moseri]KAI1877957.1 hypothetical protein JN550_000139 [Neoarthrinium moseri]